jgi:energy-converting hydrogenase B subunit D
MIIALIIVFGLMMIGAAFFALYSKDMVGSIIAAGAVSLLASVLYLVLGAPDVAMTEAAIGSALSVVVFLFAWSRVKKIKENKEGGSND